MMTEHKDGWLIEVVDRNGEGVCWVSRPDREIAGYGRVTDPNPRVAVQAAIAVAIHQADAGHPWDGMSGVQVFKRLRSVWDAETACEACNG